MGDTAGGAVGVVAVEDFGDVAQAGTGTEMAQEGIDNFGGLEAGVATETVGFEVGFDERSNQPGPDRTLMIGAVALELVAAIVALVTGIRRA